MKIIENLLAEYKIRFRDTEKIKEEGYPWGTLTININGDGITPLISVDNIWTKNGKVWERGIWATADLKEKPEGWVIEKDESHPMWGEFVEWYGEEDTAESYRYITEYNSAQDLAEYKDHQYLTLDQWAEFFLPKEKEIDFSILNKEDVFYLKSKQDEYLFTGGNPITKNVKGCIVGSYYRFENRICNKNGIVELRNADDKEKEHYYISYPELRPIKVGDWGIFYDQEHTFKTEEAIRFLAVLGSISDDGYYCKKGSSREWDNFCKIDPDKPLRPQIDEFLKQQTK